MTTLIVSEYVNNESKYTILRTITAAKKINKHIHLLIIYSNFELIQDIDKEIYGVYKILFFKNLKLEEKTAENIERLILSIVKEEYTHIIAPNTIFWINIMPRVSANLDVSLINNVIKIYNNNTFEQLIYFSENSSRIVKSNDSIKIIIICSKKFNIFKEKGKKAIISNLNIEIKKSKSKILSQSIVPLNYMNQENADIIVAGGKGLGSKENFTLMLEPLADLLGASIGASRSAVDAGYASYDYQIGQTGKIVSPQLYFAIGISGAMQHFIGIKNSKIIVAINKDPNAPILNISNYILIGDLFVIIPELIKEIKEIYI